MSKNASDLIKRNNNRVLFAAKVIQQTAFLNGIQNTNNFEGSGRVAMSYNPTYYSAMIGAYETTPTEQAAYIASVPRLLGLPSLLQDLLYNTILLFLQVILALAQR